MTTTAAAPIVHVRVDEQGRAWIDGSTMKVVELIAGVVAYGWTTEDLARQYPHLTPGQIHGALAYYHDHRAAMEQELNRISRDAAIARAATLDSPLRRRLASAGKTA